MANPTRLEMQSIMTAAVNTNTPASGTMTDAQVNQLVKDFIDAVDNLDPDRPVKVRNLNRK